MTPAAARQQLRAASLELARLRRIRGAYRTTWRRIARARARLALAAGGLATAAVAVPASAADPLFRTGFVLPSYAGTIESSPALADLDGDGDLDIFIGNFDGATLLRLNTGSAAAPAFADPSPAPFPDVGTNAAPTFSDLDGDGDLDVFIGNYAGDTVFLENTGTVSAAAFAPPVTNPFALSDVGFYAAPAFGDLDGDGDLDALVGNHLGVMLLFANTGTATAPSFAAPSTSPSGLADVGSLATPELVDIDGDGDLDVFAGAYTGFYAALFLNTGTASMPAFAASPARSSLGITYLGHRAALAFGDVDGDGDLDGVVTFQTTGPIPVMLSFENTGSASAPAFNDAGNPFGLRFRFNFELNSHTLADIDGDGDLDAFLAPNLSSDFHRNTGTASAPAFAQDALPESIFGREPVFVDIDGDGDLDSFVGGGDTVFRQNTGSASSPTFAAASTNPFGLASVGLHYAAPSFVDIDGDGDLDAFIGAPYGSVVFFENTGSASTPAFAAPASNPFGLAQLFGIASPVFADLDGDGDLDALIGDDLADLAFYRNTGSVTQPAFAPRVDSPFGLFPVSGESGYTSRNQSPELADIDGDGDLDLFVSEYYVGRLVFFENVLIDPEACTDGLDNDGDGRIDLGPDPGCAGAADNSELGTKQCDNGQDDDADGKVDFRPNGTGDPHCTGPRDDRELPDPPPPQNGCGLGPELLLLAPLLAAERRRRRRRRGAG